ncbi:SsgA family sporulation/cell division regulator [Streptomyces sp. NPDC002795]|uniref:SsgA family sporulation/cell division regulator n=1 Tax=Streptomyces sp. NPDC002795 TaxID=3364665 RepID=UPI0036B6307B
MPTALTAPSLRLSVSTFVRIHVCSGVVCDASMGKGLGGVSPVRGSERRLEAAVRGFAVEADGGACEPCDVRLRYSTDDPLVVSLAVSHVGYRAERWLVSRDLLSDGLSGTAGSGDVTVCPVVDPAGPPGVLLRARDAGRTLRIRISHQALLLYLARSHALVPFGSEVHPTRIDKGIEVLLAPR